MESSMCQQIVSQRMTTKISLEEPHRDRRRQTEYLTRERAVSYGTESACRGISVTSIACANSLNVEEYFTEVLRTRDTELHLLR